MELSIDDETMLAGVGLKIGQNLNGGEMIELVGDVGAGKTTLTRAIARGMGIGATIQSPTFTISNRYETSDGLTLAHYDFYRLHDAGVMKDELAESLGDAKTVVIVEWGNIITDVLPNDRLTIEIMPTSETERQLAITAHGPESQQIVETLA